ncbi:glycosyltransferase [Luteibacter sp.]|uniref:glycosyltransferase n=1 Tax=Luteibacter sp. TaxID=1886636 RepID=UPI003F803D44
MNLYRIERSHTVGALQGAAPTVVAIPVRNEARHLGACLEALAVAARVDGAFPHLVLAVNGCTDATWEVAMRHAPRLALPVTITEVVLSPSADHAGGARAAALRLGLDRAGCAAHARIFTTDADTRVAPDWLVRGHRALADGADAVAGLAAVASPRHWPMHVRQRHAMEQALHRLLDEIDALCDPVEHNPWPTHRQASGANLAFRADALRRLNRWPIPSCGEDRALIQACHAQDLRVRHEVTMRVTTSARLHGRAAGGMADTLCHQAHDATRPCDTALEAVPAHISRAERRARARRLFDPGMSAKAVGEALGLAVPGGAVISAPCRFFGTAWQLLEALAPGLARQSLRIEEVPRAIEAAERWLAGHAAAPVGGVAA